eukprot:m.172143 g.172143  ORF g.172143 m.172143 type:complete len:593 (-) comp31670_c0_seq2:393-2171(-)
MAGRPPTGRVPTAARGTSYGRIGTGAAGGRLTTGRLPTGSIRPGTRGGGVETISVGDQPMTDSGVAKPRTALPSAYRRTVEDESFYVGELRKKSSMLTKEIARLQKEVQSHQTDHGNYQSYEKRAESLSKEIKVSQNDLTDLNLMDDHFNHHIEISEVMLDIEELKAKNNKDERDMDDLFSARSKIEEAVKDIHATYEKEKAEKEDMVNDLSPDQSEKYFSMRREIEDLGGSIGKQQSILDRLNTKVNSFEEELRENPVKREAMKLYEQIAQMKQKNEAITAELEQDKLQSPEEQRKRLLEAVRADNQEIAGMENKMQEITNRVTEVENELMALEEENDDASKERKKKYMVLMQREKEMATYLDNFPSNYAEEIDKMEERENAIVGLLKSISENMKHTGQLPDRQEVEKDRKLLGLKQQELIRSEQTANTMQQKTNRLTSDLNNVENLEAKISSEVATLKTKLDQWKVELVTYDDISGLKQVTEAQKTRLLVDKKRLLMRREITKRTMAEKTAQFEKMKSDLEANETYGQLQTLEKRWQQLEKQRYGIEDFIKRKETESNYKPYVAKVTLLIKEHNKNLKNRKTTYVPSVAT